MPKSLSCPNTFLTVYMSFHMDKWNAPDQVQRITQDVKWHFNFSSELNPKPWSGRRVKEARVKWMSVRGSGERRMQRKWSHRPHVPKRCHTSLTGGRPAESPGTCPDLKRGFIYYIKGAGCWHGWGREGAVGCRVRFTFILVVERSRSACRRTKKRREGGGGGSSRSPLICWRIPLDCSFNYFQKSLIGPQPFHSFQFFFLMFLTFSLASPLFPENFPFAVTHQLHCSSHTTQSW